MTLTTNQRKCLWLAVIAAAIYYIPSIVTRATHANQPQAVPMPRFAAPIPKQQDPPAPFRDLLGQHSGRAMLARGVCGLSFEIRDNREKPGMFSGYSSMTCAPAVRMGWYAYAGVRPTAAILTGTADADAIHFKVDDTISGNCRPTEMTVRRFGLNQIFVTWSDTCKGGKMVLVRTGR
jgi:hypothetical protein